MQRQQRSFYNDDIGELTTTTMTTMIKKNDNKDNDDKINDTDKDNITIKSYNKN